MCSSDLSEAKFLCHSLSVMANEASSPQELERLINFADTVFSQHLEPMLHYVEYTEEIARKKIKKK